MGKHSQDFCNQWTCCILCGKSSNMSTGKQKSQHFIGDWADFIEIDVYIEKSRLFVSAGTFFLDSGWPWEKIINKSKIFVIHVFGNLRKQQIEIFKSIYHVCFWCFNQAVQDCACFCTVGGLNHYEVLSTNGKRPDCLFRSLYWY